MSTKPIPLNAQQIRLLAVLALINFVNFAARQAVVPLIPLLRDHLLRLDRASRHDRFNGFLEDEFVERYAAKCADDGTIIIDSTPNVGTRAVISFPKERALPARR